MANNGCCSCGDDKKTKLLDVIEHNKDKRGALIQVLHEAQLIYGYLPLPVQKVIAEGMNIPLAEVYGVVTFYAAFTLSPKGKYKISVCLGTACYVKGAGKILDKIKEQVGINIGELTKDNKFSLDVCRCIGACGLAPVITINEDVFGRLVADEIPGILAKYKDKE